MAEIIEKKFAGNSKIASIRLSPPKTRLEGFLANDKERVIVIDLHDSHVPQMAKILGDIFYPEGNGRETSRYRMDGSKMARCIPDDPQQIRVFLDILQTRDFISGPERQDTLEKLKLSRTSPETDGPGAYI